MDFIEEIAAYQPACRQEAADKKIICDMITSHGRDILSRSSKIAHMTASGFIVSRGLKKTLMIHHHIYQSWGWTGGHADGCGDLLQTALREAREETGVLAAAAAPGIAALDILPVFGHSKNGAFVSAHLHFNACYLLLADESAAICHNPSENSGAAWIALENINETIAETHMRPVYQKLVKKVRDLYVK